MKLRTRRGATLIEILVVSALFLTLLSSLLTMGMTATTGYSANSSKMMADDNASLALQRMTQEIRSGLRVTVDANAEGVTVVMPRVNSEGDYDRFSDGIQVRYYLEGGRLYRKQGLGTPTIAGRNVSAARFSMEGTQLDIELTCSQKIGTRQGTTTLATEVTLRNEVM